MAKTRVAHEFGMGTSLRKQDYTSAAVRALRDALWHNSLNMAEAFGFTKDDMMVDVEIACQKPDQVDTAEVAKVLPYGQPNITVAHGGLDIPKPNGDGATIVVNAAVIVSFDMERAT